MIARRSIAFVFIAIALVLGIIFHSQIEFPRDVREYFRFGTYDRFGPLAISIELLVAGWYLFMGHSKANFALALFAFTALLDPFFNLTGIFTSMVPLYATLLFMACALVALYIAFSNAFDTGRISFFAAMGSFVLGAAVELFFNNW